MERSSQKTPSTFQLKVIDGEDTHIIVANSKEAMLNALFPGATAAIATGNCPVCKKPVGKFKDELSKKEFEISGLCQACQDEVFKEQD